MTNPTLDSRPSRIWDDPDHLLTLLKGPRDYAKTTADRIRVKKGQAFHRAVTDYLRCAMDLFDQDSVIKIVHYWLAVKQLPLDPSRIDPDIFCRFHMEYHERICDLAFTRRQLGFQ